jgi:hypothetical protein
LADDHPARFKALRVLTKEAKRAAEAGGDVSRLVLPPNPVRFERDEDGRLIAFVTCPSRAQTCDRGGREIELLFTGFHVLSRLCPGAAWGLANKHPTIRNVRDPEGRPFDLYLNRVLAYLGMLAAEAAGLGARARPKGWVALVKDGQPLNLLPQNRTTEDAKKRRARNSHRAAWTIRHRLELLAEGRDPREPRNVEAAA